MHKTSEVRRGQFIWRPAEARKKYLEKLKKRIRNGFYTSDRIVASITEKLAPAFDVETDRKL